MNHYELRKMIYFQRLPGSPRTRPYNLAEHSFFVASLFLDICRLRNLPLTQPQIEAVLYHDYVEVYTTDLPYPVKNLNKTTQAAWATIEEEAIKAFSSKDQELFRYEDTALKESLTGDLWEIFKACDLLELLLFCYEETQLGNRSRHVVNVVETCKVLLEPYFKKYPETKLLWTSYLTKF